MPYTVNTESDQRAMLDVIGVDSIDDLFIDIPESCRINELDLPLGRSEMDVRHYLAKLAGQNSLDLTCFLGGGYYDHYIPAAIDSIVSRGEFLTAYTPYQPEVSQGTLQAIYEYQSMICRLTGMEVANASLYDGGTALYEAMMMALRITRRNKVVLDSAVNPIHRKMIDTYTKNLSIEFVLTPESEGHADRDAMNGCVDDRTAAVIVQNPNFFGTVDDFSDICEMAHEKGALVVVATYPISLALLKDPGSMGADIVTGEGQSLGIPLGFGGPYLGYMATRKEYVRKMPGRLCGATVDSRGRKAYVLTLQAREQHIRREKAMSNVCTNVAHMALRSLVYLSLIGRQGLVEVAQTCADRAILARSRLDEIEGVHVDDGSPVFNEITVALPVPTAEVVPAMIEKGIAVGWPLDRYYPAMTHRMLMAFTEKRTVEEINIMAAALEEVLCRF